jgi:hypothetical protein
MRTKVPTVNTQEPKRRKVAEWLRRYLPCEIAGWIGELGAAAVVYLWTGSLAAAAIGGTIGSSAGYYSPAYVNAVRWSLPTQQHRSPLARIGYANLLALRSLTVEFGPAEFVDSLFFRPILYYLTPLALGNVVLGWILGGLAADILFYICAIFSYERFGRWLARPERRETEDASIDAVLAA